MRLDTIPRIRVPYRVVPRSANEAASLVLGGAVLLSLRAQFQGDAPKLGAALPAALILAFFETALIYGLTLELMRRIFRPPLAILVTAVFYTLYHIGFYGPVDRMELFSVSFGTYLVVGVINASLVALFESPWVLFPVYLGMATLFDLNRSGVAVGGSPVHYWVVLAAGIAVTGGIVLMGHRRSGAQAVAAISQEAPLARVAPGGPPDRFAAMGGRNLVLKVAAVIIPLFVLGLFFRFIINDPVPTEGPTWVSGSDLFVPVRTFMVQAALNLGLAGYLLVPAAVLALLYDAPHRDRLLGLPILVALRHRLTALVVWTFGIVVLLFPVAAVGSLVAGDPVTLADLARFVAVGVAMTLYAILAAACVLVIAYNTPTAAWSVAITLIMYMVVYNYWMIYPLFSQYWEVARAGVSPADPALVMAHVWERAGALYAWIPQYSYYTATAVAVMRTPLAPVIYLPAIGLLATYAAGGLALAVISGRAREGAH